MTTAKQYNVGASTGVIDGKARDATRAAASHA